MNKSFQYLALSSFTLLALSACGAKEEPTEIETKIEFKHPFFVGNAIQNQFIDDRFATYWNQVTPEHAGKWTYVENTNGVYKWTSLDEIYDFARSNGMLVKAHTFIWGAPYPSWVSSATPEEMKFKIEQWISSYCTRYPDTALIDVVNEALPGHQPFYPAQKALGENWVAESFKIAHRYCGDAVLILNDFNLLSWNTDEFIEWVKPILASGEVDAIGAQGHYLEDIALDDVETNLNQIAALGLPIYISEFNVAAIDDQKQLEIMKGLFPLFYNHPSVGGITFWGYMEGNTYREGAHLVNSDGTPRPALLWVNEYIAQHPK